MAGGGRWGWRRGEGKGEAKRGGGGRGEFPFQAVSCLNSCYRRIQRGLIPGGEGHLFRLLTRCDAGDFFGRIGAWLVFESIVGKGGQATLRDQAIYSSQCVHELVYKQYHCFPCSATPHPHPPPNSTSITQPFNLI